jgi:two-component system CheB/CheR fusion protein
MSDTGEEAERAPAQGELEPIVEKISEEHGFDIRGYKRTTLYRRIRKRMTDARCSSVREYLARLQTDPHEHAQLINTILINVTEFFRDPEAWEYLCRSCLPPLLKHKPAGEPVRAWSVGCATGEEAYSLSICIAELLAGEPRAVKIYATDMDEGALSAARAGVYGPSDLENVSSERRERFFEELPGGRFKVRREVRTPVIFGHHNVLRDPPISRLDVLVCRNLLIYFDGDTQQQILKRFHYALRHGGYLFLGKAETLMSRSTLFRPVEPRYRVFQRAGAPAAGPPTGQAPKPQRARKEAEEEPPMIELAVQVDEAAAPVLLLDPEGLLLAASGPARELLGIAERMIGGSLAQLDDRTRLAPLRLAVEDARTTLHPTRVTGLQVLHPDGRPLLLEAEVRPSLDADGSLKSLAVWVQDGTREQELAAELGSVRQELETTSEELQTTNEELETTNEELQSTNEELETTNEELQSTNEELETTIEELQSTNEELETANDELRARQEELNEQERFQRVVLSSMQMGLVVVRSNWEVVSWNKTCEELWGVREEEVLGQSLFSLDSGMPFDQLRPALTAVVHNDQAAATVELDAVNRRGKPMRCRVRVHALAEQGDGSSGAILMIEANADPA